MSRRSEARALACLVFLCFRGALAQGEPAFVLPIDCEIGRGCVVQSYVDHDPGPGARDYSCGYLAYDGHKGTDIRVVDLAAFKEGVAVLAAAAGRVRAVRDGMPDISVRDASAAPVAGREAGNSVVIEHGAGWETQYAHLRKGSVAVRAGDRVEGGQVLGTAGLSGNTEFPHLHFEVRHRGKTVDPFLGARPAARCVPGRNPGAAPQASLPAGPASLWSPRALGALAYVPTGLLGAGLAASPPQLENGGVDPAGVETLNANSGGAVFWVQVYGVQQDDSEELRLIGPDGRLLAERRTSLVRNRAQSLSYIGLRRHGDAWPAGSYRGEYTLYRGSPPQKVLAVSREASVAAGRK